MSKHGLQLEDSFLTRRQLLGRMGNGFAALGLAGILGEEAAQAQSGKAAAEVMPMAPKAARMSAPSIFVTARLLFAGTTSSDVA